jgi:hypothetical protein
MTTPEDPMAAKMRVRVETEKAQEALYSAKPTISLLHHMAAVQAYTANRVYRDVG